MLGALTCCAKLPTRASVGSGGLRDLVLRMRVDDFAERRQAGDALRVLDITAVPQLIGLLHAEDSTLDRWIVKVGEEFTTPAFDWHAYAASALGEIGPAARAAIPDLLNASREVLTRVTPQHRDFVTTRARAALIKIRQEPLAELEATLADPRSTEWNAALVTAQELGIYGRPLIPTLTRLLADTATPQRFPIVNALGRIDGAAQGSTPALLSALADEDDSVRWFALRVLRHAVAPSVELRDAVAARLADSMRSVRQQAIETLASITPREARENCARRVEPLLKDPAEEVRATAKLRLNDLAH